MITVSTPRTKQSDWYRQMMLEPVNTDIWYTRLGDGHALADMSNEHIKKCIAMIEESDTGWRIEFLVPLKKELARRKSELGEIIYGTT